MHKEQLLPAICKALGIEAREHHEVVGVDKGKVKSEIRGLKEKRAKALEAHDSSELKKIRRELHRLKTELMVFGPEVRSDLTGCAEFTGPFRIVITH